MKTAVIHPQPVILNMPSENTKERSPRSFNSYSLIGRVTANWRQCVHAAVVALLITGLVFCLFKGDFFITTIFGIATTYHFTILQSLYDMICLKRTNIQFLQTIDMLKHENVKLDLTAGDFSREVRNLKGTTEKLREQLEKLTEGTAVLETVSAGAKNILDSLIKELTGNLTLSDNVVFKLTTAQETIQERMDKAHVITKEFFNENIQEFRQLVQEAQNNKLLQSTTLDQLIKINKEIRQGQEELGSVKNQVNLATDELRRTQEECKMQQNQMQELRENLQKLQAQFFNQCELLVEKEKILCGTIDGVDDAVKKLVDSLFQHTLGQLKNLTGAISPDRIFQGYS